MLKRLATALVPSLPYFRAAVESGRLRDAAADARVVGWPTALRLWLAQWDKAARPGRVARLRFPGFRHPVRVRRGGSDPLVARGVFVGRDYHAVATIPGVRHIIDCGANVGFATFYLLTHYPAARAVVVEPDAANMAMCRQNLAPFADRVTFVQAGVWSAAGPLVVERGTYRDGQAWAFQCRPARPGETPDVTAVTIPDLMAAGGFPHVDVLKVDIEGAEAEVFGAGSGWMRHVRNLAIETHGPECERAVAAALEGFRFRASTSGELAVYHDIASEGTA